MTSDKSIKADREKALYYLFDAFDIRDVLGADASIVTLSPFKTTWINYYHPDQYILGIGVNTGREGESHVGRKIEVEFKPGSAEMISTRFDGHDFYIDNFIIPIHNEVKSESGRITK